MEKTYLGDSVYCRTNERGIVVYLDNGYGPTSEIVMEPEVIDALMKFLKQNKIIK